MTDRGVPGCFTPDYAYTGTECGFNVDTSTGEMAHMHYNTLGNIAAFDTSGAHTACYAPRRMGVSATPVRYPTSSLAITGQVRTRPILYFRVRVIATKWLGYLISRRGARGSMWTVNLFLLGLCTMVMSAPR